LHWRLGWGSATGHASHGLREIGTDRHGNGTGTRSPAAIATHDLRQIGTASTANCNFLFWGDPGGGAAGGLPEMDL